MIIGPSHVVRWEKISPAIGQSNGFYGRGGLPVWHPDIKKIAQENYNCIVLVGDFRFGNCFEKTFLPQDMLRVDKDYISQEIDRNMYEKSIVALSELETLGVRFIFWCLFGREYKNRLTGKYFTENGDYLHPVWNIKEIEYKYSKSCFSLSGLLKRDLRFLFVDSSNHPSIFGFLLLKKIVRGTPTETAYQEVTEIKHKLNNSIVNLSKKPNRIILSGVNNLFRLTKENFYSNLLETSVSKKIEIREADEALFSSYKFFKTLIFFTNISEFDGSQFNTFLNKAPYEEKLVVCQDGLLFRYFFSLRCESWNEVFSLEIEESEFEITGGNLNFIGFIKIITGCLNFINKIKADAEYSIIKTLHDEVS